MKLYDTVNGTYIFDTEVSTSDIRIQVYQDEFTEDELENYTIEGKEIYDSTQLADLKAVAYFYASGDSGSILACSDGRHVDTVWGNGVWDTGELLNEKNCHARFEEMLSELEAFEKAELPADPALEEKAMEFAHNCVNYDIAEKYAEMQPAITEYVGGARS